MCVSGRCRCGGLDLLALAEIQGKNEACPKLSSTSGFTVVHCTQWDIAGKILSSLLFNPMGISGKICKSLGKQLAVPKNLEENNQFHEAAKSLGWFMLGIQVGSWLEYTLVDAGKQGSSQGWVDASGQSLTFTNWAENFPTDQSPAREKSVVVVNADGKWENGWRATEINALCV